MCIEKISFWEREEAGTQDVHGVAQAGGAGALDQGGSNGYRQSGHT